MAPRLKLYFHYGQRPSVFSWFRLEWGMMRRKRDKVVEKTGSGRKGRNRKCREQRTETSDPTGPGWRGHRWRLYTVTPESSRWVMLQMMGHVSSQHSEPPHSRHPHGFCCWDQITEEGVYEEKVFQSLDSFWIVCEGFSAPCVFEKAAQ